MSQNSSKSLRPVQTLSSIVFLCGWVIVGFLTAQITTSFMWQLFSQEKDLTTLAQLVLTACAYIVATGIIVGTTLLLKPYPRQKFVQLLGIHRLLRFRDTGLAFLGYGGYFLLAILVTLGIQLIWPDFPIDQKQQVGFQDISLPIHYVYAFLALVVVAPIFEEILFRGYLFGFIRKKTSFFLTALLVSGIFGLIHLQLNVAIDVFCLSLVACYLREKTGTIWASVLLHMIKNGIAFFLLFLRPDLLHLIR
jgi:membrane protease YdiL (CAAX protease family)